ncbi:hypothetical protein E7744_00345 [Citricoccus sp. SGAir0253]|uniref:hypothetical protein n=1 Tax=Citricoccus sp. SGAir0253 TaxID=2567881 RepID=UPI0010CD5995|nr:hypothetical protein [Citricoccus sp. SGAir0253]QCU76855.1 hypothetical protein E7744_00345 [Citricoccus sp. SGAir0253]
MTLNPEYPTTSGGGTQDAAKQEAGRLGTEAQDAARDVAGTAKDEARHVKEEAVGQAKDLAASARQEATSQLSTQKDRLASQSRTVSDDLERIARGERPESDMVNQAVSMLSERARRVTEHLETREPMDLLDDVRRFAARRPGTFLAIAAGVGLVAGRLTRGLKDSSGHEVRPTTAPVRPGPATGPAPVGRVPGTVYPGDTTPAGASLGAGAGSEYSAAASGDGYAGPPAGVYPGQGTGGHDADAPLPPAVPPTVGGADEEPDLGTGAPATEVLGTPAAEKPYGAGPGEPGGRP